MNFSKLFFTFTAILAVIYGANVTNVTNTTQPITLVNSTNMTVQDYDHSYVDDDGFACNETLLSNGTTFVECRDVDNNYLYGLEYDVEEPRCYFELIFNFTAGNSTNSTLLSESHVGHVTAPLDMCEVMKGFMVNASIGANLVNHTGVLSDLFPCLLHTDYNITSTVDKYNRSGSQNIPFLGCNESDYTVFGLEEQIVLRRHNITRSVCDYTLVFA